MIRVHLVPEQQPTLRWTSVAGLNRQVRQWPVIHLMLEYAGQQHALEILKVEDLPFPILLGRDAPGFNDLVQGAIHEVAVSEEESSGQGTDSLAWAVDTWFL